MEPMNCVIRLGENHCEAWYGAQMQSMDQGMLAQFFGLKPEQVQIHTLYAGGSFGRRASKNNDYILETAQIVKAIKGRAPVKLVWTREDDMQGGYYRPMYLHTLRAGLDAQFDRYDVPPPRWGDPLDRDLRSFNALFPPRSDAALAARADLVWKLGRRVEITPGLRLDLFRSGQDSAVSADGRIALRAAITDKIRLVHAIGLAHQPPSFIVPVPGLSPATLADGLQTSVQSSAGIELDLPDATTATVSAFDNVMMSGTIPAASQANMVPVRPKPVKISSRISNTP